MNQNTTFCAVVALLVGLKLLAVSAPRANAAFHLWHVKEVFTNADGSVQFIELFNSSPGEQFVANHTLRSNSDGVIKNFNIPGSLVVTPPQTTANTHFLIATPGFASLPGAVTPDFTLPAGSVPFFNPNASNITISFSGSNDSMSFSGTLLPENGFNSLTDNGAFGFPPGTPNIQVTANTPTRFPNSAGQIDLRPSITPTGDYNGNDIVDAADYVVWRETLGQNVSQGTGADGDLSGTIDQGDYNVWRMRYGSVVAGSSLGSGAAVPEPTAMGMFVGALALICGCPWRIKTFFSLWERVLSLRFLPGPGRDPALRGVLRRRGRFNDFGDLVGTHAAIDHFPLELHLRAAAMHRVDRAGDDAKRPEKDRRRAANGHNHQHEPLALSQSKKRSRPGIILLPHHLCQDEITSVEKAHRVYPS